MTKLYFEFRKRTKIPLEHVNGADSFYFLITLTSIINIIAIQEPFQKFMAGIMLVFLCLNEKLRHMTFKQVRRNLTTPYWGEYN